MDRKDRFPPGSGKEEKKIDLTGDEDKAVTIDLTNQPFPADTPTIDLTETDDDPSAPRELSDRLRHDIARAVVPKKQKHEQERKQEVDLLAKLMRGQDSHVLGMIMGHLYIDEAATLSTTAKFAREWIIVGHPEHGLRDIYIDCRSQGILSRLHDWETHGHPAFETVEHNLERVVEQYGIPLCYTRSLEIKENPFWMRADQTVELLELLLTKHLTVDDLWALSASIAKLLPSEDVLEFTNCLVRNVERTRQKYRRRVKEAEKEKKQFPLPVPSILERKQVQVYPLQSLALDLADPFRGGGYLMGSISRPEARKWIACLGVSQLRTLRLRDRQMYWLVSELRGLEGESLWTHLTRLELHAQHMTWNWPRCLDKRGVLATNLLELKLHGLTFSVHEEERLWTELPMYAPQLQILWLGDVATSLDTKEGHGLADWLALPNTKSRLTQLVFEHHRSLLPEFKDPTDVQQLAYTRILIAIAGCTRLERLDFCLHTRFIERNGMSLQRLLTALQELQILRAYSSESDGIERFEFLRTVAEHASPHLRILQWDHISNLVSWETDKDTKMDVPKDAFASRAGQALLRRLEVVPISSNDLSLVPDDFPRLIHGMLHFPNLRWFVVPRQTNVHGYDAYQQKYTVTLEKELSRLKGHALEGFVCPSWYAHSPHDHPVMISMSNVLLATLSRHHQLRHIYIEAHGLYTASALRNLASSCSQLESLTLRVGESEYSLRDEKKVPIHQIETKIHQLDVDCATISHLLDVCPRLRWIDLGWKGDVGWDSRGEPAYTRVSWAEADAKWLQIENDPDMEADEGENHRIMVRRISIRLVTAERTNYRNWRTAVDEPFEPDDDYRPERQPPMYTFPAWIESIGSATKSAYIDYLLKD
jgi:hypothetical protein